jgi:cytochrome c-type biogenesis protein CcmH/NrfG
LDADKTVILDTNVLLSEPDVVYRLEGADVVIPETVLAELDKLKMARVDPELRFKGREVSRILFELSEQGALTEGVPLPDGGQLRVIPWDTSWSMPEELSAKNADDRIIATAMRIRDGGAPSVTIVTSDLNMLLKAQSLGLKVERFSSESEQSFGRRIVRWTQKYRIPIGIFALSIAVFAGIVWVAWFANRGGATASVPVEFRDQLNPTQQQILTYLQQLDRDPSDSDTRLKLANLYYNLRLQTGNPTYALLAIKHYEDLLQTKADNLDVRTDLAASYFYSGQTDKAIEQTLEVLKRDPNKIQANFNLGIIYWQGRRDYQAAARQFEKVIELTANGDQAINQQARSQLAQVLRDAAKAGVSIKSSVPATGAPGGSN